MLKAFDYEPEFNKTTLDNGVRVVTEHHPYTRTSSAGFYVDLGSRDEPKDMVGAAHFVEHIVFKGTKKRSAYEIVRELEAVGGDLNAYTSRETTCFHASCLREHLPIGLDVLTDLMSNAQFTAEDFEKERNVILQEIDMSADLFEEYVFDLFFEESYRGHNVGNPILGTPETLKKITRKSLTDFYKSRYHGENLIVSVSGAVDHDEVVEFVAKNMKNKRPKAKFEKRKKPKHKKFDKVFKRDSEHIHLLVGLPSNSFKSKFRFESYIANALLGGGMTSKLYQKIREDKGWAYSVYSYLHSFTDSGLIMVYAGTSEENLGRVTDTIYKEIDQFKKKGITKKDLEFFKRQVKGSILLGADDVENRMNSIAVNEMIFGKYRPVDKIVDDIDKVTCDSVQAYLDKYFNQDKLGTIVLGDV